VCGQDRALCTSEVILGEARDFFEELGAAAVVEPARGDGAWAGGEARENIRAEGGIGVGANSALGADTVWNAE